MPICKICEQETPNPICCKKCKNKYKLWQTCNHFRRKRGQVEYTYNQWLKNFEESKRFRPSVFSESDRKGPNVVWDGTDWSPCIKCEHSNKDKYRYGCVKCSERSRFEEYISKGSYFVNSPYSYMHLTDIDSLSL